LPNTTGAGFTSWLQQAVSQEATGDMDAGDVVQPDSSS